MASASKARRLPMFTPIITTTSSNSAAALRRMSMWPLVKGSKEPAYRAILCCMVMSSVYSGYSTGVFPRYSQAV